MVYLIGHSWTDTDFTMMGWNNNRLYGWVLPGRNHQLVLLIDYSLRNPISDKEFGKWELVPVELIFENVINLKISLDMENYSELDIVNIERTNKRPTPNGRMIYWDYLIKLTNEAFISFTSTGFIQKTLSNPVVSETYDLDRESEFLTLTLGEKPL